MNQPLISIALATYNGEQFLRALLDSVYAQTYQNFEVIVRDDCSTDNTVTILNEYSIKYGLKHFVNEKNIGFVKNFEKILTHCKGEFIALADQDDIWMENKLELLINEIGDNLLIHSDAWIIDQNDNVLSDSYTRYAKKLIRMSTPTEFFFHNSITGCTTLFNRKLLDFVLPFLHSCFSHDWWLAIVAVKLKGAKYIDTPLIKYRQHTSNIMGAKSLIRNDLKKITTFGFFNDSRRKTNLIFLNWYKELYHNVSLDFTEKENQLLWGLVRYYQSYFERRIRIKAFFFHLKHFKYIYPHNNIFARIMRLFVSLIGEGKQNKLLNQNGNT